MVCESSYVDIRIGRICPKPTLPLSDAQDCHPQYTVVSSVVSVICPFVRGDLTKIEVNRQSSRTAARPAGRPHVRRLCFDNIVPDTGANASDVTL